MSASQLNYFKKVEAPLEKNRTDNLLSKMYMIEEVVEKARNNCGNVAGTTVTLPKNEQRSANILLKMEPQELPDISPSH